MHIVHICMQQYSDGLTYQENMLAKYHKRLGNAVTVITSMYCIIEGKTVEDTRTDFLDINGVRIIRLRAKTTGFMHKLPIYEEFSNVLSKLKPDIIFSHGCQYRDVAILAEYIGRHPNVRLFVDSHADFGNSATNFASKYILHGLIWKHYAHKILPYAQKFWGVLPARVSFLTDMYGIPPDKCDLLVMGADDDSVNNVIHSDCKRIIRQTYGIKENEILLVTGGKINRNRPEVLSLLKAVCNIANSPIKLLFFGTVADEYKDEFELLCKNNNIVNVGWKPATETYKFMYSADIVFFPGLHSVMWEQAVALGTPCVFRDISGFHHVDVGGNCEFISNVTENGLRETIQLFLENPGKIAKMRSIGEEYGMKRFSYMQIAKQSIECKGE